MTQPSSSSRPGGSISNLERSAIGKRCYRLAEQCCTTTFQKLNSVELLEGAAALLSQPRPSPRMRRISNDDPAAALEEVIYSANGTVWLQWPPWILHVTGYKYKLRVFPSMVLEDLEPRQKTWCIVTKTASIWPNNNAAAANQRTTVYCNTNMFVTNQQANR